MSAPAAPAAGRTAAGREEAGREAAEKDQVTAQAVPRAMVIHEVVREEGEEQLRRRPGAVLWSGFAAGLSMGFSFLGLALVHSLLPAAPWARLVDSAGYTVGFLIVILGRQELFTESTLSAVLPLLVRRDRATFAALLRFWVTVLAANLAGTAVFAAMLTPRGVFLPEIYDSLVEIARAAVNEPFWPTLVKAVFAGWLIALMVWLLPGARSARILVILILTYVVALGRFSHVIAGSAEAAFAVLSGNAPVAGYFVGFLAPTLIGNMIGGVALVSLLNHAPLAPELQGEA